MEEVDFPQSISNLEINKNNLLFVFKIRYNNFNLNSSPESIEGLNTLVGDKKPAGVPDPELGTSLRNESW